MIRKKKILNFFLMAIITVLGIALLAFFIPKTIDNIYMVGYRQKIQPNTMFSSSDVLIFYGSFLTFIGTTFLGISSLKQNQRLHNRNIQIEKENKNIQLLLAQDMAPFVTIDELKLNPITSIQEKKIKTINCIDKSTSNDGSTIYTINIFHHELKSEEKYLFVADFSLKNSSKAKINEIKINHITLDRAFPIENGRLEYRQITNELLQKANLITQIIYPESKIYFRLKIICDSDYRDIIESHFFRTDIRLELRIITGPRYYELIKVHNIAGISLPVEYSINENLQND